MRLGIQTKWALLNVAAVGVALGPASVVTISRVHGEMNESARLSAEAVTHSLRDFSFEPLLNDDDLAMGRVVTTTMDQPGVRYAVILSPEGAILAQDGTPAALEAIPASIASSGSASAVAAALGIVEPNLVHSKEPILLRVTGGGEKVLGLAQVGYSFAEKAARIRKFALALAALNIAGLAAGVALGIVFAKRFSKPVLELTDLAQRVSKGSFDVSTSIVRSDEIGTLAVAFNEMTAFLRKGQFMKNAFERYVSADLVEQIERNPGAMAVLQAGVGERREVTVLFLDVRGFTRMSEKMSAEDVVKFLVGFFNRVSEPVFQAGGAIDKFIGDAMMAVFGFPISHGNDPLRAVETALRIRDVVTEYNQQRTGWGMEPIAIGMGINTGMVVAGNVGCDRKLDYTVIGDAVNVASRLVGLAAAGQILISGTTFEQVSKNVAARTMGEQQVKGREKPVAVFEVTGLAGTGAKERSLA